MRSLAAALLAAPTLARLYAETVLRRSLAARLVLTLGLGVVAGFAILALARPPSTTAVPATKEVAALPPSAFSVAVRTSLPLTAPIVLTFSAPMDRSSVRAALTVEPPVEVRLSWDQASTRLTIEPADRWLPGAYQVVTVATTAQDRTGTSLAAPVRSTFLVRPRAIGRVAVGAATLEAVGARPSLTASVEGDVDPAALARALAIDPAVAGRVAVSAGPEPTTPLDRRTWQATFIADGPLAAGTTYRLFLTEGLVDRDGAVVETPAPLTFRTSAAPTIVRFRPVSRETGVATSAEISVRFDQPMDRVSTERAFRVSVGKTTVAGALRWAEGDTVLVLDPSKDLARSATVTVSVGAGAHSKAGFTLGADRSIAFTVVAPPKPKPTSGGGSGGSGSGGSGGSGGGSVGGGSWASVERYYFGLLNCTRTGGWVTTSGSCSSPGGSGIAALRLDAGISTKVARPYAKLLAIRGQCGHTYDGSLGDRLRRAGYGGYYWAGENVGCRPGTPTSSVLRTHLAFQDEKSYNGPHWKNIMNPIYDRVGIGVWVASGRIRLVTDFYKQ